MTTSTLTRPYKQIMADVRHHMVLSTFLVALILFSGMGLLALVTVGLNAVSVPAPVKVGGPKPIALSPGNTFDALAFCKGADRVIVGNINSMPGPETLGLKRAAIWGTQSVEWQDTGSSGVAVHYWISDGVQQSEPVEVSQAAAACMRTTR